MLPAAAADAKLVAGENSVTWETIDGGAATGLGAARSPDESHAPITHDTNSNCRVTLTACRSGPQRDATSLSPGARLAALGAPRRAEQGAVDVVLGCFRG
jgi:hypothetical protein